MTVYYPGRFYDFCRSANARDVLNFILSSITTACHSKEWVNLNKKQEGASCLSFVFVYHNCVVVYKRTMVYL